MKRRSVLIMFILFVVFLLVMPAAAQDVTPESTPSVIVTPAPVVTDVPAGQQPPSLFSTATLGELLLFLGLSGLAGGGIVAILLSFLGKKEVRDRVEDARNSWSPEQQQVLANFTGMFERTAGGILDFLKAVQDGKPNTDVSAPSEVSHNVIVRADNQAAADAIKGFVESIRDNRSQ